jgi:hypothetical protein
VVTSTSPGKNYLGQQSHGLVKLGMNSCLPGGAEAQLKALFPVLIVLPWKQL